MRSGLKIAIGVAGLMLAFSQVQAQNEWSQWRGMDRDCLSKETGLLKELPASGPELKWKATDLGIGYSGISVVKGTIYSMGDADGSCQLMAFAEDTGKKLWSTKVGEPGGGAGYAGPRCTPTVAGGNVYALGQFGDLICADAATGKEVWKKNLAKELGGQLPNWGYAESPLFDDGKLFCTPGGKDGSIIALDAKNGATLWRTKDFADAPHYSSMILETVLGQKQLILREGEATWIGQANPHARHGAEPAMAVGANDGASRGLIRFDLSTRMASYDTITLPRESVDRRPAVNHSTHI